MLKYLFDGAFGTYIFSKNPFYDFPELANMSDEKIVTDIHREYIEAGATAIRTNTFGANRTSIHDTELCDKIIRTGYRLACEAARFSDVSVFADIGPNDCLDGENEYLRIADIFITEGAKNFIFETQNYAEPLEKAISHIKSTLPDSCVIVSFGIGQDGFNKSGEYFDSLFEKVTRYGADFVGFNCICGPAHILDLIKQVTPGKYNLTAMPNSGYPTDIGGRTMYSFDNPEYFAAKVLRIYSHGAQIIGGCCGSTPEYIRCISDMLQKNEPDILKLPSPKPPKTVAIKNDFANKFIAVEIEAPQDIDANYLIKAAKAVKKSGADFVTIPDSPLGKIRANTFMMAALVQRHAQIPVIPHICCRDKNSIAIKGDLIAANIEDVSRALVITGDAPKEADRNHVKSVFGFNSFRLISYIKNLNEMTFFKNPYTVCGALNINSTNFEAELARAEKKIESGVDCLFTQPIFSDKHLENYFLAKERLTCKIAAGIMPLASYKNALFLSNEVPGIEIPAEVIESLKDATPDKVKQICIAHSKSIIDKISDNYDGFYIMTQMKKIDYATELVKYIKERTNQ